jgi:RNA polymerase sigma-70 factor (ECF subfamily)
MSSICNIVREDKKTEAAAAAKIHDQSEVISLVKKAAAGNIQAFGHLYKIYLDQIYRYVLYHVNDKMTAEDITEEVFLKAWKVIKSCRGREKTFSSWLYRIAHNHMVNVLRDNNRITYLSDDREVEITDPARQVESNIEYQEMLKAIACLPENQKQVIILKFIEGLDNREISRIMGKNEGAVRITQMRALARLRKELGEKRDEDGQ